MTDHFTETNTLQDGPFDWAIEEAADDARLQGHWDAFANSSIPRGDQR